MKKITIYTTDYCPFCARAKALLERKELKFDEVDVSNPDDRMDMMKKADGRRSVPQIFVGDFHVGGCDNLYALDKDGKLDELVK